MKILLVSFLMPVLSMAQSEVKCTTYGSFSNLAISIVAEEELVETDNRITLTATGTATYKFNLLAEIVESDEGITSLEFKEIDDEDKIKANGLQGSLSLEAKTGEILLTQMPAIRGIRSQYDLYSCSGSLE